MKINTHEEAISTLLEIQNLIREKNENKLFAFVFELNSKGQLVLSVRSDFRLEFKDKNKQSVIRTFIGPNSVKVVNDFLTFFTEEGGEGIIIAYGNHFRANFHYENNWVVDNISNGPYMSRYPD